LRGFPFRGPENRRGNAYTAGDIVGKLGLSPPKKKIATVGATLFRLVKEGRVKKDKVRGYRAA